MRSNKKKKIVNWSLNASHTPLAIRTAAFIVFLSMGALLYNHFVTHFPGNNYFPPHSIVFLGLLILIYCGMCLQFGQNSRYTHQIKELQYFFLMMSCMALASNAIQFTPYPPIDIHIVHWEQQIFSFKLEKLMAWAHARTPIWNVLALSYDTLPYCMLFIPLLLIALDHIQRVREYYCLMLISTLIGFCFYYFFPTTGPASCINSPYFTLMQQATSVKFNQIHQHIHPTTIEGGMIAFPSFHVIWAWFCLYLLRIWPVIFAFFLPVALGIATACVLLGWHYPSDIIASFVVIGLSHGVKNHLFYEETATTSSSLTT